MAVLLKEFFAMPLDGNLFAAHPELMHVDSGRPSDARSDRHWSFKWVMRGDIHQNLFRLFRVKWRREDDGSGHGYYAVLSVALRPSLLRLRRVHEEYAGVTDVSVTLACVRVRYFIRLGRAERYHTTETPTGELGASNLLSITDLAPASISGSSVGHSQATSEGLRAA